MADPLAALQQAHVEVAPPMKRTSLIGQLGSWSPRVLGRRAGPSSGQWNWYRSMASTPRRLRLCSQLEADRPGRRSGCGRPSSRPYQFWPHLVKTMTSRVTSTQDLADDLLGVAEPVHGGGVDPVDPRV